MPIITAIKPQKYSQRVNIYLDGKFGFGIDLENYVKSGLKVEQELSQDKINEIVKKAEYQKNLDKLLKFAMLRPRSTKEITNWFYRKKIHQSLQEQLFARIKDLDLIDDEKFAVWWIKQRSEFRPMGINRLKNELLQKGISKEIISNSIEAEVKPDEQKNYAIKILMKKLEHFKNLEKNHAIQKAFALLARRGFDFDLINEVIDESGLKE